MNKLTKRILSLCLALAMIVTILPQVATTQAATTTKKLTLYVGEKVEVYVSCKSLSSVSSSKKAVAKTSKSGKKVTIAAKKAGSAKVTITGKDWYNKTQKLVYKITVKKPTFSCNVQPLNNGYVLVTAKNTTGAMFDKATLSYTLKDRSGEVVKKDSTSIYKLFAGKVHYEKIYVGTNYEIDCDASSAKVSQIGRYEVDKKYKNIANDAVEYKELNLEETDSQIKFDLKLKNTLNKEVAVKYFVIAYDANDNIIDVPCSGTRTLSKKEVNTASYNYVSTSQYTQANYDHYKIVVQGCYETK